MYSIDSTLLKIPLLLNDLFVHLHRRKCLRVFLCGQKPHDIYFDLRVQTKKLLESRMGCKSFLGEEIDISLIMNEDHLSIEVKEAEKSDLILMFLGSPGTFAELTAFVLNDNIRSKLVVFNDISYKNIDSFINLGPLKMLPEGRLLYFDAKEDILPTSFVINLDLIVANVWYEKSGFYTICDKPLSFREFAVLATIYAGYPIRYNDLVNLYPLEEHYFRSVLKILFSLDLIKVEEYKYLPVKLIHELSIDRGCINDLSLVRLALMDKRLIDQDAVSDYRLLF